MKFKNSALRLFQPGMLSHLLPSPGNIFFTLLVVGLAAWAQSTGALSHLPLQAATSTDTIAYQGRLADTNGNPLSS